MHAVQKRLRCIITQGQPVHFAIYATRIAFDNIYSESQYPQLPILEDFSPPRVLMRLAQIVCDLWAMPPNNWCHSCARFVALALPGRAPVAEAQTPGAVCLPFIFP
jgi:hypothetical protein